MNNPFVEIYIEDCREALKALPPESVHCVVTSPPYWALRDYQAAGQIGLESSIGEFLDQIVAVFGAVKRVMHPTATLWMNISDTYIGSWGGHGSNPRRGNPSRIQGRPPSSYKQPNLKPKDMAGIPWRVAFALQESGFYLRSEVIWHKPNAQPESAMDRPGRATEKVFLFSKSERYFYDREAVRESTGHESTWEEYQSGFGTNTAADADRYGNGYQKKSKALTHPAGRNLRDVWTIPTQPFKGEHRATFPLKLAERCILAGTSERAHALHAGRP